MDATGVPLLEGKLHVPRRRRGVVERARLAQRLNRDALPAVVLVSAPAGFGKTTPLAEWPAPLGRSTNPVCTIVNAGDLRLPPVQFASGGLEP